MSRWNGERMQWINNADISGVMRVVRKTNSSCYCIKNKLDFFSNPRTTLKNMDDNFFLYVFPLCIVYSNL